MTDRAFEVSGVMPTDDLSAFGAQFGPDVDAPRRRRTVVARSEEGAIGVASATWSRRHPDYGFADIEVTPTWQRRGVATSLLEALQRVAAGPLLFNVDPDTVGIVQFLESRGYRRLVASQTVRIDAATMLRVLQASTPHISGIALGPEALSPEIERLFEEVYAERHRWAGAYRPTPGKPWIASAGDLVNGTLFVARKAGRPIAATCVHSGPFSQGADGFVAPTGVADSARASNASDIIRSLLTRTLAAAVDAGLVALNVEYDTPYVELHDVFDGEPVEVVSRRTCLTRP